MKKYLPLFISGALLVIFIVFTVLVSNVDVQAIGPNGSCVGFATMNSNLHEATGVNMDLYKFTDYLSLLTIPVGTIFAVMGVVQWVKRKSIFKVDANILALGIFYVVVFISYLLFQFVVINYRPVLIEDVLEASYPSSTTVLSLTLFVTAIDQVLIYIKDALLRDTLILFDVTFSLFLIIGRVFSGVHWASDIIGAILLSAVLICSYFGIKVLFKHDVLKAE